MQATIGDNAPDDHIRATLTKPVTRVLGCGLAEVIAMIKLLQETFLLDG